MAVTAGEFASRDALIAQDGYWIYPHSGLIEQWGRASLVGGVATQVNFPIPFPTQCFQVVANVLDFPSATIVRVAQIEAFDSDGALIMGNLIEDGGMVSAPAMTVLWRAIGF